MCCLLLYLAGRDATDAFYGLHRHEIILRPQYARLQIGVIEGQGSVMYSRVPGELSKVPYAEPTWLVDGYYSPYFTEVYTMLDVWREILTSHFFHIRVIGFFRRLCGSLRTNISRLMLWYVMSNPFHLAAIKLRWKAREEDGKRPSMSVIQAMAWVKMLSFASSCVFTVRQRTEYTCYASRSRQTFEGPDAVWWTNKAGGGKSAKLKPRF
jgi:hypothetical protein